MFVVGNLLNAISQVIDMSLTLYMYIVIARALISWVNPDPYNPIVQFLHRITEPIFYSIRRWLPIGGMGIDISPIIVIVIIIFLKTFLVQTLHQLAMRIL